MIQKRAWHGVGIVFDEEREESLIIVTGGHDFIHFIGSTEVLINNEWTSGKNSLLNFVGYCDLASFQKVNPENEKDDQKILDNQKVLELFG